MTSTHSSLESLQELYPVLASLPPPRFMDSPTDISTNTDMEEKISQQTRSTTSTGNLTSSPSILLPTLAHITPPLCILYIALLGYMYGCPIITDDLHALAHMASTIPEGLLAAALLVSCVGLFTSGAGFVWRGELPAGDKRI